MMANIGKAVAYLDREMPKPATLPDPMSNAVFVPTDRQLSQYDRKVQAALDPLSVLRELRQGTLTKEHVDTLNELYPKFIEAIRRRVTERMPLARGRISAKAKESIKLLMGMELLNAKPGPGIQMLQDNFAERRRLSQEQTPKLQKLLGPLLSWIGLCTSDKVAS